MRDFGQSKYDWREHPRLYGHIDDSMMDGTIRRLVQG